MPDRANSPFKHAEFHHSFDDGRTWLPGKPSRAVENDYPGTIRYLCGGTPQPSLPL